MKLRFAFTDKHNRLNVMSEVDIHGSLCLVGRGNHCQVRIADAKCSQQHALFFEQADGKLWVKDLGSTNGTYVNGKRLTDETAVSEGCKFKIGSAEFQLLEYVSARESTSISKKVKTLHMVPPPSKPKEASESMRRKTPPDVVFYIDDSGNESSISIRDLIKKAA